MSEDLSSEGMVTPQIYVACLSAYSAGYLHGSWIDAVQDVDLMRADIAEMLAASPAPEAEEWAIHDTSGFDGVTIGEYESLHKIAAIVELLETHPGAVVSAFLDGWGDRDSDELVSVFEDVHGGSWSSVEDFADEVLVPSDARDALGEELYGYLDLKGLARDREMDGGISIIETPNGVHVIWTYY
jgi:antirestriction protein